MVALLDVLPLLIPLGGIWLAALAIMQKGTGHKDSGRKADILASVALLREELQASEARQREEAQSLRDDMKTMGHKLDRLLDGSPGL